MALKIIGFSRSRAFRPLWLAEEIKLAKDVEYEHIGGFFHEGDALQRLVELNPMAQVPVLQDENLTLAESMAINFYMSKKYGVLAPNSMEEEARILQWSFWVMTAVEALSLDYLKYSVGMMGVEADPDKAEEIAKQCERPFKVLEDRLSSNPYILGDSFSLADLNVSSVYMWAHMGGNILDPYPATKAWLGRCMDRPAAKAANAIP